jgi:hypothetical protein
MTHDSCLQERLIEAYLHHSSHNVPLCWEDIGGQQESARDEQNRGGARATRPLNHCISYDTELPEAVRRLQSRSGGGGGGSEGGGSRGGVRGVGGEGVINPFNVKESPAENTGGGVDKEFKAAGLGRGVQEGDKQLGRVLTFGTASRPRTALAPTQERSAHTHTHTHTHTHA